MTVDRHCVEDEIEAAFGRFIDLVRSLPPAAASTPVLACPGWTVADVAAHLLTLERRCYADARRSSMPEQTAALNATCLDEVPDRDLRRLAEQMSTELEPALSTVRGIPDDLELPFHAGLVTTIVPMESVLLAEVLVHGHDVAVATEAQWTITEEQATLCIDGVAPVFPAWVDDVGQDLLEAVDEARHEPVALLLSVFGRTAPPSDAVAALIAHLRPL